ncbi:unnamed protein product [Didymodactylos carnosus]|uniref:Uncharacterized protein n=1 Tax=Didymodactylos carnosus TaxID=1234261 RepID=A0A815DY22_9BILA|nr:unnamed protein product [Didymodactylos carnosus]CAF1307562.1 unnamed protein product [Didymodactylos carnosus]CAF3993866.1 unnamed protein product [Didymodactylos carnosus]CAF4142119.1 unnamed protein product [Didymodactylos carnosus]
MYGGRARRRRQLGDQNQGWANTNNRYPYSNQNYGNSNYGQYGNYPYGGSYGQNSNYGNPNNNNYGAGYYNGYRLNGTEHLRSNMFLIYILCFIPLFLLKV